MKPSDTSRLAHGKVVHELGRRVRIISPVLLKDPERACVLEILLQKRDGIEKVRSVPDIASVVIYFDPSKLPKAKLFILLDALLANLGKKKPPLPSMTHPNWPRRWVVLTSPNRHSISLSMG